MIVVDESNTADGLKIKLFKARFWRYSLFFVSNKNQHLILIKFISI